MVQKSNYSLVTTPRLIERYIGNSEKKNISADQTAALASVLFLMHLQYNKLSELVAYIHDVLQYWLRSVYNTISSLL